MASDVAALIVQAATTLQARDRATCSKRIIVTCGTKSSAVVFTPTKDAHTLMLSVRNTRDCEWLAVLCKRSNPSGIARMLVRMAVVDVDVFSRGDDDTSNVKIAIEGAPSRACSHAPMLRARCGRLPMRWTELWTLHRGADVHPAPRDVSV